MVHSQSLSDSFSYHFIGGQEMKNILVSVEGVDYTGKTTNAKGLANRIGAEYYKTPSNVFDDIRKIFNDSNDTVAKYLFYMSTLKLASEEIKKILEYRNVIVDRYLTTTICYHAICGAKIDVINVEKLDIRKPDFSFCLKVNNKDEWLKRIKERDGIDMKIKMSEKWEHFNRLSHLMTSFTRTEKGLIIDTTLLPTEKVVQKMALFIENRNLI
jgi:thymidylate kinase